jgi:hypothetical protein
MARPRHRPEPFHRRQVEAMAGYGVPEAEIAGMIGIDPKTLRKHYRLELDQGHTKANIKVAENLFRKATGDGREGVTAAIFWLKARAGWKETRQTEISVPGGQPFEPVTRIERIILTPMLGRPGDEAADGPTIDADDGDRSPVPPIASGRPHHGS